MWLSGPVANDSSAAAVHCHPRKRLRLLPLERSDHHWGEGEKRKMRKGHCS